MDFIHHNLKQLRQHAECPRVECATDVLKQLRRRADSECTTEVLQQMSRKGTCSNFSKSKLEASRGGQSVASQDLTTE